MPGHAARGRPSGPGIVVHAVRLDPGRFDPWRKMDVQLAWYPWLTVRDNVALTVDLPTPRDQITTKQLPEFVRLRNEVSRLVRGRPGNRRSRSIIPNAPRSPVPARQRHFQLSLESH